MNQIGTYWFHSHVRGQYPDGLRAPFIVHDPDPPFQFDEEVVLSFSDWYDSETVDILQSFISYKNPTGAEPIPDAALMNDTQNLQFNVQPGKTYYFRMVNLGAFVPQYIWFEGHTMRIIEVDGVYTQPAETQMIYIAPAQRYGVLITMLNSTSANFPIVGSFDTVSCDDSVEGCTLIDRPSGPVGHNSGFPKHQRNRLASVRQQQPPSSSSKYHHL